jgi:hypothetical protein
LILSTLIGAASVAACVDAQVNRIGPTRPSRPAGCAVEIVAEGPPSYPVVDVASGVVSCSGKRDRCLDEIRKMACAVGADTVYDVSETADSGFTHIAAKYAAREQAPAGPS